MDVNHNSDASELQRDAEALLEESALLPCLKKYGQVLLTGSYRYHLMVAPDIDISIANPCAGREQAKEIVGDLISQGYWRGISFDDFIKFPREDLPSGIYLGLKRSFRGQFWKVDVWLLSDIAQNEAFDDSMSRLTNEQRSAIMQIKYWRREANLLSIPSKLIYDAVLYGRAHDVESFQRLIEGEWYLK